MRLRLTVDRLAILLRKPRALKYNSYIELCYRELEICNETPTDLYLRYHVELQKVKDEICTAFGYDERYETTSLGPERIQLLVQKFASQLHSLRASFPPAISKSCESTNNLCLRTSLTVEATLLLGWYWTRTLLHEIVFHVDISDTAAEEVQAEVANAWRSSAVRTDLILGCLEAAKGHIDCFLQLPDSSLQVGAMLDISSISYSVLALGKLALGAGLAHDNNIVRDRSNLMQYFDNLIAKFESCRRTLMAVDDLNVKNVFYHFYRIFAYTRAWFQSRLLENSSSVFDGSSTLRDAKNLSPLSMLDEGQEAAFVKNVRREPDPEPAAMDQTWDEMMNDLTYPPDGIPM